MLESLSQASVPRDVFPPTPPGPEGSNGNGLLRVQWVAGVWLFFRSEAVYLQGINLQSIDLRCHDEVALGQPVDLVGPQGDFRFAPGQQNIRMMSLRLGQCAYSIHKIQGLFEIGESESACNLALVDYLPLRN